MRLMNPVHILIGTPGRIRDLADKRACDLRHASFIALDEADKLLSPEFGAWSGGAGRAVTAHSIDTQTRSCCKLTCCSRRRRHHHHHRDIAAAASSCVCAGIVIEELLHRFLPKKRQILLFSATFPIAVKCVHPPAPLHLRAP